MSKPQELNELQVERVIDLWFMFIEEKYGYIERNEAKRDEFIEWLGERNQEAES